MLVFKSTYGLYTSTVVALHIPADMILFIECAWRDYCAEVDIFRGRGLSCGRWREEGGGKRNENGWTSKDVLAPAGIDRACSWPTFGEYRDPQTVATRGAFGENEAISPLKHLGYVHARAPPPRLQVAATRRKAEILRRGPHRGGGGGGAGVGRGVSRGTSPSPG